MDNSKVVKDESEMDYDISNKVSKLKDSFKIKEYKWFGKSKLLLWVYDYDYPAFKELTHSWLFNQDNEAVTRAYVDENCICIEIDESFLDGYYSLMRKYFPLDTEVLKPF